MVPVETIGLMSGTCFDGRRCRVPRDRRHRGQPHWPRFIAPIRDPDASCCDRRSPTLSARRPKGAPGVLSEAEQLVTEAHAETVERLFQEQRLDRVQIAITGFHGQTVLHRHAAGLTIQIGDGPGLARRLGSRWRTISGLPTWQQDGKSLVLIYHQRLPRRSIGRARLRFSTSAASPTSPLSIRTMIWLAFDTGPGKALDDFMHARTANPRGMKTALQPKPEQPISRSSSRFATIRFSHNHRPNVRVLTYRL